MYIPTSGGGGRLLSVFWTSLLRNTWLSFCTKQRYNEQHSKENQKSVYNYNNDECLNEVLLSMITSQLTIALHNININRLCVFYNYVIIR